MSVLVSVLTNDRFYSPTHQIHLFWQPQTSHSLSLEGLWQFQFHLRQALETRTGTPDDIATSATKPKPSVRDGMTAKSASRNIFSFLHNCRSHEWLTGYVIFSFPPGTMFPLFILCRSKATASLTMSYPLRAKSSNINILNSSSDNSRSDCVTVGLTYSSKIPGVMTST